VHFRFTVQQCGIPSTVCCSAYLHEGGTSKVASKGAELLARHLHLFSGKWIPAGWSHQVGGCTKPAHSATRPARPGPVSGLRQIWRHPGAGPPAPQGAGVGQLGSNQGGGIAARPPSRAGRPSATAAGSWCTVLRTGWDRVDHDNLSGPGTDHIRTPCAPCAHQCRDHRLSPTN